MLKLIEEKSINKNVYKIETNGYWGDCDLERYEEDWVRREGTKEEIEEIDRNIKQALRFWFECADHDDDDFRNKFSNILQKLNIYLPYCDIYDRDVDVLCGFIVTYYDENGKEYRLSIED